MKKPCDCCKRYLDHLNDRDKNMTCFLSRMTSNFKHKLLVPDKFLKHFTGEVLGSIKLESPNGCLYDVQVTHNRNKMVLKHGWEAFIDAHHIKENDSLLFRHVEECCFEVLIFDSDGCQKMFPCAGIKNTPSVQERSVDSVDISSSSQHDNRESSGSERYARCEKHSYGPYGKYTRMAGTSSSYDVSEKNIPSESESFEADDLETPAGTDFVISGRSRLSEAQKERVIAFVQEIKPEVTVLVSIMNKSHVQPPVPYMAITKEYAFTHFPRENTNVTLLRPGSTREWHPKFNKRKDGSTYMLRGEWLDFVCDNHVREGDICLLLPIKGVRKFTYMVHLLRATATSSFRSGSGGTCFQRVGPYPGRSNAEMGSEVQIKEESTDGEPVHSGMHAVSDVNLENGEFDGPCQPPYIVASRGCLSRSQKKIVEKKVLAMQSELPIYVGIMGRCSVGNAERSMLELGLRYSRAVHLPASSGQTVVLQYMRKIWKTKMVVQGNGRLFLKGDWPKFVRDNGLQVGDICLLELKKDERELTMAVHIITRKE